MTNYNDGKWHGWNGGECPVHPDTVVDVVFDSASKKPFYRHAANNIYWENSIGPSDIIAFRVIKEHRGPREFWISNNDGYAHESLENALSDHLTEEHGYIHVREVLE